MNKRGVSLTALSEMILGLVLVMACLLVIVGGMNNKYGQNNNPTFGIASNETLNEFAGYQQNVQTGMEGEATINQQEGISLTSSWGMIKAALNLIFGFINGQWIYNGINLLHLGAIGNTVALILRIFFILAIAFILFKILFKIIP
jgi:hypothetical protein